MATALNIIERALRSIGVLAQGENASAEMANDALVSLNDVLAGAANENLLIYKNTLDTLTLDGSSSYTIGQDGTPDLNTVRPISIHSVFHRGTDGIDCPVDVVTLGEFDSIADKSATGTIVEWVYVDTTYPNLSVYTYPLVSTGTLRINSSKALTAFASLTTTVSLPPGYERYLRYALAVELMPEYGINNPQIYQMFNDARADLKRTNAKPVVLRTSVPFGKRFSYNRIEEG